MAARRGGERALRGRFTLDTSEPWPAFDNVIVTELSGTFASSSIECCNPSLPSEVKPAPCRVPWPPDQRKEDDETMRRHRGLLWPRSVGGYRICATL